MREGTPASQMIIAFRFPANDSLADPCLLGRWGVYATQARAGAGVADRIRIEKIVKENQKESDISEVIRI